MSRSLFTELSATHQRIARAVARFEKKHESAFVPDATVKVAGVFRGLIRDGARSTPKRCAQNARPSETIAWHLPRCYIRRPCDS